MPRRVSRKGVSGKEVREALAAKAPKATRLGELLRTLGLPKTRRDQVLDLLGELIERGVVEQLSNQRFRLRRGKRPETSSSRRSPERAPGRRSSGDSLGWIALHARGFGFVSTGDGPDVFVPASKVHTALHGDRVRLRVRPGERGREGRVVEVVERGVRRVSGRLLRRGREAWIEPDDERVPRPVLVTGTWPLGVRAGADVVAAIETYPQRSREEGLRVRILGALGPRGSAATEIERIEIREGVEEEFGAAALAEAQGFGTRVPREDLRGREDLRSLALVTIDPADARDHDDAVFGEVLEGGGFRIVIAIADVSHYVAEGGALDRAAFARGTSIYLPDRVVPMLPFELSSNLASLVPGEPRLALVLEVILGPRGAVRSHRYAEAVIRSHARLSYEGVAHALRLSPHGEPSAEAEQHRDLLQTLWQASQILRAQRRRRGSLEFDLPEAVVALDPHGEPATITRARADPGLRQAYGMIEDLMLLANEVVAGDLARRGLPTIYRIHGAPDEERVARFAELATSLGYALDEDAATHPRKLADLLRQVEGTPHAQALHFLLLRAMQQASYDTQNVGHFALAARSYLHFTSPIRRYPDLAVHRIVRRLLRQEPVDHDALARVLATQAANASRLERRAQSIDREVARLYAALLLRDRIDVAFEATITSLDERGLWVTLDQPFVEARCPIEALGHEDYVLDPLGLRLTGRRSGHPLSLGDRRTVWIDHVSVTERSVTVRLEAERWSGPTPTAPPARTKARTPRGRDKGKGASRRDGPRKDKGKGKRRGRPKRRSSR